MDSHDNTEDGTITPNRISSKTRSRSRTKGKNQSNLLSLSAMMLSSNSSLCSYTSELTDGKWFFLLFQVFSPCSNKDLKPPMIHGYSGKGRAQLAMTILQYGIFYKGIKFTLSNWKFWIKWEILTYLIFVWRVIEIELPMALGLIVLRQKDSILSA